MFVQLSCVGLTLLLLRLRCGPCMCKKRNKESVSVCECVCVNTYCNRSDTSWAVDNEQTHRKEVASCFFYLFNGRSFLELFLNTGNETFTSRSIKFMIIILTVQCPQVVYKIIPASLTEYNFKYSNCTSHIMFEFYSVYKIYYI